MKNAMILTVLLLPLALFQCKKDSPVENIEREIKKTLKTETAINKDTILTINDQKYSNVDLRKYIEIQHSETLNRQSNKKILNQLFQSFLNHKIILFFAQREKIGISDEEIENQIKNIPISVVTINKEALRETLLVQKFLYFNLYRDISVSEKEIQEYYNQNISEFQSKERVKLYQIVVDNKEKALQISSMLKNQPQRFEELARRESISHDAKKGGYMGLFEKGDLPLEMEKVVFTLPPYVISPVTESEFGFHIFRVTQRMNKRVMYISKARPIIKNKILSNKLNQQYVNFIEKAKQELKIIINDEALFFNKENFKGESTDEIYQGVHPSLNSDSGI